MPDETDDAPLVARVHYDFASTLCYVAHRVMQRMQPDLDALRIELRWSPVDLTRIAPFRRGAPVEPERRANAARVAADLGVAVEVPPVWPDSRALGAAAIVAERHGREASFRERAFSAVFEERRPDADVDGAVELARDLGLALATDEVEDALDRLERRSDDAREAQVTGVPTFMLGAWPFGGIQTQDTMRHVLRRWAERARRDAA